MAGIGIEVDEQPDISLRDKILRPLVEYNVARAGLIQPQNLALLLRDPGNDEVVGGLWGRSAANWLFVDLLVVPQDYRRRGFGRALMSKAEEIAVRRGDIGIWLCSATFQAPEFYEKLGYTRFGKLDDFPKGYSNIYYCKRINAVDKTEPTKQMQGKI